MQRCEHENMYIHILTHSLKAIMRQQQTAIAIIIHKHKQTLRFQLCVIICANHIDVGGSRFCFCFRFTSYIYIMWYGTHLERPSNVVASSSFIGYVMIFVKIIADLTNYPSIYCGCFLPVILLIILLLFVLFYTQILHIYIYFDHFIQYTSGKKIQYIYMSIWFVISF